MIGRVLNTDEWLAYVAHYDFGTIPPARLVLHHTYRPNQAQWRGLRSMRGMQHYYAGLGWSSAPHIYVAPDGIWLFTPMSRVGIHAGTGNQGHTNGVWWYSIGLEMVGYFDYERPSGAVWDYARTVMGSLANRLDIAPRQLISFHRDYTNQKSCPGWAVTKEWVFGEVEAWLQRGVAPPPPPPGTIGKPTPADEIVLERLLNESFERRSQGYNVNWAFHQSAVQHDLGAPISDSKRVSVDGSEYSYQPFARATLYSEVPNWGTVLQLSDLLGGSIPPSGLGRVLLEAIYRDNGAAFHADWAFHQYALSANLGPPIGKGEQLTIDGVAYNVQVFALDTLYNPIPDWGDVRQLSRLANTNDPAEVRLRDALLGLTYQRVGANYNPGWAFHQLARQWRLGAPLSDAYGVDIEGVAYNIQVYALDTIYNIVPHWQDVRRLSDLVAEQSPGGNRRRHAVASLVHEDIEWAPRDRADYAIWHYTSTPPPSSYSERSGSRVALIVLHGDPGPAATTLERMADLGTADSTHYYILMDGTIYQLISETYAAWHAGMAWYEGRRQNINRISVGVVLERPAHLEPTNPAYEPQRRALGWLTWHVARRHDLPPGAVVRWLDLAPQRRYAHSQQPLDDITLETVIGW
jgi:N-acetyl-anhydromuramyl-L-alanine amidase AmpD